MPRFALAALGVLLSSATPALAQRHPLVEGGRELYEQAQFQEALDSFARAEAASDLSLDDLLLLFESRALVHHATGDETALDADLARLAAIDPSHAFGPGVPPDVRDAFVRVRSRLPGRLRLRVEVTPSTGGAAIAADVVDDPAHLVRAVRVHAEADDRWLDATDAPLLLTAAEGSVVRYYAEAIGPGGAVVATRGTREAPLQASLPRSAPEREPAIVAVTPPSDEDDERRRPGLIAGLAVGAVAVVAAAVALPLVLGRDRLNDTTDATITVVGWP